MVGPAKAALTAEKAVPPARRPEVSPSDDEKSYMHFVHFDAQTGKVSYIDDDKSSFGAVCECPKCGTVLEFEAERCPICGANYDEDDFGIVALVRDQCFDWCRPSEMDCPQCGQHVVLVKGMCPVCEAPNASAGKAEQDDHSDALVSAENIVYLHLDVESGEVEYLQRLNRSRGFEHAALHVNNSDSNGSAEG